MTRYRVSLGDPPTIFEHEIKRETSRHYVDETNRIWYKNVLRDYRWFDTYEKAVDWVIFEYKMRKNLIEIEYTSVCQILEDMQKERQSITTT